MVRPSGNRSLSMTVCFINDWTLTGHSPIQDVVCLWVGPGPIIPSLHDNQNQLRDGTAVLRCILVVHNRYR